MLRVGTLVAYVVASAVGPRGKTKMETVRYTRGVTRIDEIRLPRKTVDEAAAAASSLDLKREKINKH